MNSLMNTVIWVIGIAGAILLLFNILTPIIKPVFETLVPGLKINTGVSDAYETCLEFDSKFYVFDYFTDSTTKDAKTKTSIAERLISYTGSGDLYERWQKAKKFCGASIGLVSGANAGHLERSVKEINTRYGPYGAKFDFDTLNEYYKNNRESEWVLFVMQRVAEDLDLRGGELSG